MAKKKNLSSASRGLRYKLKISVYLMSILPMLVCIYLVSNYILPQKGLKIDVAAAIIISIFIAAVGFFVVKEVFDRILAVTTDAKLIAAGDITHTINPPSQEDEVGDLGDALNQLTQRIRSNMDELKTYSEKTTEINIEIQKRVLVLSSLLQISSLISQGAKLEDILKITVEKSRLLANSDAAYLLLRQEGQEAFTIKVADGISSNYLLKARIEPQDGLFLKISKTNKPFILDKQNVLTDDLGVEFYDKFKLKNTLAIPVFLRGRIVAALGIGNTKESFVYNKEDLELLDIFAKQIAIAIENDLLIHRVEKLEIKDALTGLYNEAFIRNRLQEEIKRAITYQRPCGFILMNVDNFKSFHQSFGSLYAEATLKKIASLLKDSVSDVDRVGRVADNEFAIILPEKNKRQAQEVADNIRKKVEFSFGEEQDPSKRLTISGGVSENPLDGIDAAELFTKASELLKVAKERGRNCVASFKEKA